MSSATTAARAGWVALTLAAVLGCDAHPRELTGIDLATGETRTFSSGEQLPSGWAACANAECSALPAGIPCQNLGAEVCGLTPGCEVRPLPCSAEDALCGRACVPAATILCEQLTAQADCAARPGCSWEAAGACGATSLPQCSALDSDRCAARPDCRWTPGPCATTSCSSSGCAPEACAPFCQTAVAPESCPEVSPPPPGFCPEGQLVAEYSGNCVIGFTCQGSTSCPAAPAPDPEACPGGLLVPKRNALGCLVGYECRSNGSCTELAAKYAQLVENAKACDPEASGQCQLQVPDSLGCGCPTLVNAASAAPFDDVRKTWEQLGCNEELACPMSPCAEAVSPGCASQPSSAAGRCES